MISPKMMKSKARANLERYGTDEHIAGIGMATNEKGQSTVSMHKTLLCSHCPRRSTEKIVQVATCDLGYNIITDRSTAFVIQAKFTDAIPNIGDAITFHIAQNSKIAGCELNGKLLYILPEEDWHH